MTRGRHKNALRWWRRPPTRRKLRLCERHGHRWGQWLYYGSSLFSFTVTFGDDDGHDVPPPTTQSESGRTRFCRRCDERQYLNVEMRETIHAPPAEPRAEWQPNPDAWKA